MLTLLKALLLIIFILLFCVQIKNGMYDQGWPGDVCPRERLFMNEDSSRVESGHVLLRYNLSENAGKLLVECQKTADLILEIILMVFLGFPFILGGLNFLYHSLYGFSSRSLYGIGAALMFAIAVMVLARGLALIRDGFRRIEFSVEDGQIVVYGCYICRVLGSHETLRFFDTAGFRVNRFSSRRYPLSKPENVYEIVLVRQNGDTVTIFPYFPDLEAAEATLKRLVSYTGIPSL